MSRNATLKDVAKMEDLEVDLQEGSGSSASGGETVSARRETIHAPRTRPNAASR